MVEETLFSQIMNDFLAFGIVGGFIFFVIAKYLEQKKGWSMKETWDKFMEFVNPGDNIEEGFEHGRKIK